MVQFCSLILTALLITFVVVYGGSETDDLLIENDSSSSNIGYTLHSDELTFSGKPEPSLETCRSENEELLERLMRLERIFNVSQYNPDVDDLSLMEVMYITVKENLSKSIPPTDEECHFNFITAKCTPPCFCTFKPQVGDYTPSRMCRLIPDDKIDKSCNHFDKGTPWAVSSAKFVKNGAAVVFKKVLNFLREKAPQTDPECTFSVPLMQCLPSSKCALTYHFGDFSPGRSCRYRAVDDQIEANRVNTMGKIGAKQELVGIS